MDGSSVCVHRIQYTTLVTGCISTPRIIMGGKSLSFPKKSGLNIVIVRVSQSKVIESLLKKDGLGLKTLGQNSGGPSQKCGSVVWV